MVDSDESELLFMAKCFIFLRDPTSFVATDTPNFYRLNKFERFEEIYFIYVELNHNSFNFTHAVKSGKIDILV